SKHCECLGVAITFILIPMAEAICEGLHNNLLPTLFVSGWSVHSRHGDVIEAKIHAEDRAMMDQVVEDEVANHCRAWHGKNRFSCLEQRPRLHHLVVFGCNERLASRRNITVEEIEDFLASRQLGRLVTLSARGSEIPRGLGEHPLDPTG